MLLIINYSRNTYGICASAMIAKIELLALGIKNFDYNIQEVNIYFHLKGYEIAFGREENPDTIFQLFKICKSYLATKFQEAINKL